MPNIRSSSGKPISSGNQPTNAAIFPGMPWTAAQASATSNTGAKTGQLTGITDVQNANRSKAHVYDKLGRLKEAKDGSDAFNNPSWTQSYSYDRYGNRTGVSKSGSGAAGSIPLDGLASLVYINTQSRTVNNRITSAEV